MCQITFDTLKTKNLQQESEERNYKDKLLQLYDCCRSLAKCAENGISIGSSPGGRRFEFPSRNNHL